VKPYCKEDAEGWPLNLFREVFIEKIWELEIISRVCNLANQGNMLYGKEEDIIAVNFSPTRALWL